MFYEMHYGVESEDGCPHLRGGVAQWYARLIRKVVGSSPIKCPRCFIE